jgi:hypothetical protein
MHGVPNLRFPDGAHARRMLNTRANINAKIAVWHQHYFPFSTASVARDRDGSKRRHRRPLQNREREAAGPTADGLYRTRPQPWIRYCEGELGCSVEMLDDYGMKEFTLLVRCNQIAAAEIGAASPAAPRG